MWWCWAAVVVCCAAASAEEDLPWWQTAVFYQVYPRSFKDSDGDGVGDLKGILQQADYLKELGVTAIWISPIFTSPMVDFGYDISDYKTIDPVFGTMDDFKVLRDKLRDLGIKLLLDLVPNHSSDRHPWFQRSVRGEPPYDDYYVWHSGSVDYNTGRKTPPNNWVSQFSGSAWEWNDQRQQFYLHQFDVKQPDLNYRNPQVVKEMDSVIQFWLNAGVDGFRVDAVQFLFEDAQFRNEPTIPDSQGELDTIYTKNLPETYDLLRHWADLVYNFSQSDNTSRALFLEVYDSLPTTARYCGLGNQNFMQPFNFLLITDVNQSTRPELFRNLILTRMAYLPHGAASSWVIGNHDNPRAADRYGSESVDAMNLLTGVLPGVKVVYNGEELGMEDTYIRWDQTVDPSGLLLGPDHYLKGTRDPERTPMQWDNSTSSGFSNNKTTWLPVNPNYWWLNVEAQRAAPVSHLKVFQAMAKVRKDPVLQRGDLKVIVPDNDTLVIVRTYNGSWFALIINFGSFEAEYTSKGLFASLGMNGSITVAVASTNYGPDYGLNMQNGSTQLTLRPKAAVLLKSGSPEPSATSSATHLNSAISVILIAFFQLLWSL